MDLDAMRAQWAEHDRKLDVSLRLNRQLLNVTYRDRARSALSGMIRGLAVECALNAFVLVVLGDFIYEHRGQMRFALPAVLLDLYMILILQAVIRQIAAASQIDYNETVATIQRQIEQLRILGLRTLQGILLTAPLAWTPLFIVMLKGFLGLDAYRLFGVPYILANVLFGIVFIPVAFELSKRFSHRFGRSPIVQRLMQDLSGQHLKAAAGFLTTLSEFEQEGDQ